MSQPELIDTAPLRALLANSIRQTIAEAAQVEPPPGASTGAALDPDALEMLTQALLDAADGGKHLRARLTLTIWQALQNSAPGGGAALDREGVGRLAGAVELFHVSALIHDDIVDDADTRRGRAALHRRLAADVAHRYGAQGADRLGRDLAVLAGDLAMVASESLAHQAVRGAAQPLAEAITRTLDQMRAQVMVGQFLDTLAPATGLDTPPVALDRAAGVALAKSAHYSVTFPLLLGAIAAQADAATLDALGQFGAAVGFAFQLRDDLLGVFGQADATGKPSDSDLTSGKRTVLIALARSRLPAKQSHRLAELLNSQPNQTAVTEARQLIESSHAADDAERLIAQCR
ncbi:MAG: polyprenyl synthetase family protein, partial [Bifidobacteriaceae bacterium]|nr:polyprenyl synthetase family protein [Bifidobacteriaceae bacterium]